MAGRTVRAGRSSATREQILAAAERLFAEHGVLAVSNRQVSEAAGQGNNFAVGYHFGTKEDLVREIVRRHSEQVVESRRRMLAEVSGSGELRDWVACLVRPLTEHLATLGVPSWFARFSAQVMTEPAFREIVIEQSRNEPSMQPLRDGLRRCVPALPVEVAAERADMARHLMMHTCAERERALAEGAPTHRGTWDDTATGLIDAITGLLLAPVTPVPEQDGAG
ncbi:TetR/AcrR family transcriptional regulator [Marinactinospora rubrisoli]|uniref:TetR/AcrR family transcriptional regulator n=1 Tax=Marinactinospora rubrisoli TaxID=2715399 RepID=A0ABW2KJS6_9ACTN